MDDRCQDGEIKQRILDAGVRLFAKRGYAGANIREIAEAAGVTKPMLYYYFGSKEGLARAALRTYADEISGRVDAVFERCTDAFEMLVELVWEHFECFRERRDIVRLGGSLVFGPEDEVPGIDMNECADEFRQRLRRAASIACEAGLTAPDRVVALAEALEATIHHRVVMVHGSDPRMLTRALATDLVTNLVYGTHSLRDRVRNGVPRESGGFA